MNLDYLTDTISQAISAFNQTTNPSVHPPSSYTNFSLLLQITNSADSLSKLAKQLSADDNYMKQIAAFINMQDLQELHPTKDFNPKQQFDLECEVNPLSQQKPNFQQQSAKIRGARGPYKHYSIQFKENVIFLYKQGITCSKISELFEIPTKNIVRWCKNGAKRKPGAGRKILDPYMQDQLNQWIRKNHELGSQILMQVIRNKAKQLSDKEEFIASLGWFKNFIKRYRLKDIYQFK